MEGIEVRDLVKVYDGVRALDGVSLAIDPGNLQGLVGPNGSGKTTLFRVLLGLARPDGGSVSVPAGRVGCGFQQPRFYEDLTVAENLSVFAGLADAPEDWVDDLIERCRLEGALDRRAADLSGGFAKRLDLALALVGRPDVVLADEPLADVDDGSKPLLVSLLAEYATAERIVVVTSHQLPAFADVLDAVTVLQGGSVRFDGAPAELEQAGGDLRDAYLAVLDEE